MAIKVKIFEDPYSFGLEQKIENYTNNLSFDTKIIDIKYYCFVELTFMLSKSIIMGRK